MKKEEVIFIERKPSKELVKSIDCFWYFDATSSQKLIKKKIVPDNKVDIIFFEDTNEIKFFGPMTKYTFSTTQKAKAVRFNAQWVYKLIGVPLSELVDSMVDISNFPIGREILKTDYIPSESFDNFNDRINNFFHKNKKEFHSDNVVDYLVTSLEKGVPYKLAKEKIGFSDQYIRRLFQKYVGLSPKKFEKVERLQRVINNHSQLELSNLAVLNGYFDQSHMCNDFQELAGDTPESLMAVI